MKSAELLLISQPGHFGYSVLTDYQQPSAIFYWKRYDKRASNYL